jgi:serine/threonine protein phosphatase 1
MCTGEVTCSTDSPNHGCKQVADRIVFDAEKQTSKKNFCPLFPFSNNTIKTKTIADQFRTGRAGLDPYGFQKEPLRRLMRAEENKNGGIMSETFQSLPGEQEDSDVAYTYAVGDIHGSVTVLRQLMELLPLHPQDTLVFLGDYMDRGEDSVGAVRELQQIQQRHENSIFLRGNHDDSWLDFWDGRRFARAPYMPGARQIWYYWNGEVPADVGEWLSKTYIQYEDEYAYYVHAGAIPGQSFYDTPLEAKLWGNTSFLQQDYDFGKPVVFGHYQLDTPIVTQHKIGIDTGAYQTGILTAVRLPDRTFFQTRPANR